MPCGVPFQPLGAHWQVQLLQLSRSSCRRGGWRMCVNVTKEHGQAIYYVSLLSMQLSSVDTQNTALPSP